MMDLAVNKVIIILPTHQRCHKAGEYKTKEIINLKEDRQMLEKELIKLIKNL